MADPSTTPRCVVCGAPVRSCRDNARVGVLGRRIVDGQRWNWACGRVCGGSLAQLTFSPARTAGLEQVRLKQFQARLQRYIAACRHVAIEGELVPIRAMVKVMAQLELAAYRQGYKAARRGKSSLPVAA